MTNQEYHNRPEISNSDLLLIKKSPFYFKNKHKFKQNTDAFTFGSALHTLVLEPEMFDKEYMVHDFNKRKKEDKEKYQEILNNDIKIVNTKEYDILKKMSDKILNDDICKQFLKNGKAEESYFSKLEDVDVKCRPDYFNKKNKTIIDLKTTTDASLNGFMLSASKFNYHIQASFYIDLMNSLDYDIQNFLFIAIEKTEPFSVGLHQYDSVSLDRGREQYKQLLDIYKWCKKNNNFYEYKNLDLQNNKISHINTMTLPAYKFYEN